MAEELVRNEWAIIFRDADVIELRWLPSTLQMTDGGFMATLCLLAWQAEMLRPQGLLIDAREFRHRFAESVMAWRDTHVVPRYGAAGVRKFGFVMPAGFPDLRREGVDGPAIFPTKWLATREEALAWLRAG